MGCFATCFSRDHNNYCVVWTLRFLKGHLFDFDLFIGYFSACDCYTAFVFFVFQNTTVNVEPLRFPFSEKTPHAFQTIRFVSYLASLRFLTVFIFVLISAYPLPPPLDQIGSIFDRMWCHSCSRLAEFVERRLFDEAA